MGQNMMAAMKQPADAVAPVGAKKYCVDCGAAIPDGARFCPSCGRAL
jgi:membrane protease subunit (stomatin/prohibitin family)